LVVYLPLRKIWKSVRMIIPNIWEVIKFHGSNPPTSCWLNSPSKTVTINGVASIPMLQIFVNLL
jgi:hypothetical protein